MSESATTPVVRLEHIARAYHTGSVSIPAVRDISLEIQPRMFSVIVGPSGSGKTTLLNMIGCIDVPDSGRVEIRGQNVLSLSDNALADFRARTIGYVFQSFNLIPQSVRHSRCYRDSCGESAHLWDRPWRRSSKGQSTLG